MPPELLWFWETCLTDNRDSVVWVAAVWMMLAMGVMRFSHIGRSCLTSSNDIGFFCHCLVGKSCKQGKRAPFEWSCPRFMPGGTDLLSVLSALLTRHNFSSTKESPRGLLPSFLPIGGDIDDISSFGDVAMTLNQFHSLSRQIILANKPLVPSSSVTSCTARKLLPRIAEIWNIPPELRARIRRWDLPEAQSSSTLRLPDQYSPNLLESALQVKTLLVRNLSERCGDLRCAQADLLWETFCSRSTCNVTLIPPMAGASSPSVQAPVLPLSETDSSSTSPSSSASTVVTTKRPSLRESALLPWLKSATGQVLHFRDNNQPLCQHFIADSSCHGGSTVSTALATRLPLCYRCWSKMSTEVRRAWTGQLALRP